MRHKAVPVLVTAMAAMAASSAVAGPITTLLSWGVNVAAINLANDVAASNYATLPGMIDATMVEDMSSGGYVGPNYGGQGYDLEALFVRQAGVKLQVAGITGALWNSRPGGATGTGPNNANYGIGDVFVGRRAPGSLNGNTFSGYGIELTGATYSMSSSGHTTGFTLKPLGAIYSVSSGTGYNDGIASSRTGDARSSPGQLIYTAAGDGVNDGTPEFAATLVPGYSATVEWEQFAGNRHSAFFMEFDLAAMAPLLFLDASDVLVHWGELCANDYLEASLRVDLLRESNVVPEPEVLGLLLAGMLGACVLRRRV